jgi:hypothetical protein
MNLFQELEADLANAEAHIITWLKELNDEVKAVAAMVWSDVKMFAGKVEASFLGAASAALPGFIAQLKAYAIECAVQAKTLFMAEMPAAIAGPAKLNYVIARLWEVVMKGGITLAGKAFSLGTATLQTIVQQAAAGVIAGV